MFCGVYWRDTASKPSSKGGHVRFSTLPFSERAFPCLTLKYRGVIDVTLFGASLNPTITHSERSYTRRELVRGWSRPAKKYPAKNPCRFFAGTPDLHIGQGQSVEPKVQRLLRAQRVNRVGLDGQYASNAPSLREAGALQVA